jgi:MFS family permease
MGRLSSPTTPLPSQVKRLGLVSFFNDLSSEMMVPLLPAFITGVLHLGPQVLGLMEGLAESTASILKYFAGWWSDRIDRRKPLAVFGYGLSNLVRPLMAFCTAGWQLVAVRFADRVGKGLRTAPRDALIAQAADPRGRGRAFGFHRAMDHLGALFGPLLVLALMGIWKLELPTVFLIAAAPGLLAFLTLVVLVRERKSEPVPPVAKPIEVEPPVARSGFGTFVAASVLFTLGNSSDTFLVLRAHELGLPVLWAPVVWAVLHFFKAATSTRGGALSDRIGRRKTLVLGWLIYAACYLGFAFAGALWQLFAILALYGLSYGLSEGTDRAYVADLFGPAKRGHGFGLYHLSVGLAALPASLLTGFLWDACGHEVALGLGALLAFLAAAVLWFAKPRKKLDEAPRPAE